MSSPTHHIFPLYGLKVTDGETQPQKFIFEDATIVGRKGVRDLLPQLSEEQKDIALKGGLMSQLVTDWSKCPPRDHLVEPRSEAYVAVRRNKKGARPYARSIAAFLSACAVLRGRQIIHFSIDGRDAVWLLNPLDLRGMKFRTDVRQNVFFATKPVCVGGNDLRDSFTSGSLIPFAPGVVWDISKQHPASRIMLGQAKSGWESHLREVAIHLNSAGCSGNYALTLQMAVSTLEMLIGTRDFKKLEHMASSLFPSSANRSDIHDFIKARHDFVHEGKSPDDKKAKSLAQKALAIAWVTWGFAASLIDRVRTRDSFQSFVLNRDSLRTIVEEYKAVGAKTGDLESFLNRELSLPTSMMSSSPS